MENCKLLRMFLLKVTKILMNFLKFVNENLLKFDNLKKLDIKT